MRIEKTLFPGGVNRALTLSYDDGREFDRRLVGIMNAHGIKGTFHLNSKNLGATGYIQADEVGTLYCGHEVSAHMYSHPFPTDLPDAGVLSEINDDRRTLESLCNYPVRGMSYPFGNYDSRVISLCRAAGMEYSRTTRSTASFGIPDDFMMWNPTCHHNGAGGKSASDLFDAFIAPGRYSRMGLFYMWGHSYEFDGAGNWDLIEAFCEKAGGRDDIWYATNIDIVNYTEALSRLRTSADCRILYNPSAFDVWVKADGTPLCIEAGQTVAV